MTCSRSLQAACAAIAVFALPAAIARAQITRPGAHLRYGAEVDAHLVVQWEHQPAWHDEGLGLGVHVALPVLENGPVRNINNSLAVAFGLDWANFAGCHLPGGDTEDHCAANDFWLPVVAQWNFYFSDVVSAFPELGLAIEHTRWNDGFCRRNGDVYERCNDGGSRTYVELVMWLGVRFHIQDNFALTLRIGTPSLLLGASFFL